MGLAEDLIAEREEQDARVAAVVEALRSRIGACREQKDTPTGSCDRPAEFVLWGKLLAKDALGPRCYDCAAGHVGHNALGPSSGWALINLREVTIAVLDALDAR